MSLVLDADAVTIFDTDGITVRFMNQDLAGNNIKNAQDVIDFVSKVTFAQLSGLSRLNIERLALSRSPRLRLWVLPNSFL